MNQLGLFTFMNMNLFAGEIYRLQNNFPVMVIKFEYLGFGFPRSAFKNKNHCFSAWCVSPKKNVAQYETKKFDWASLHSHDSVVVFLLDK